MFTGFHNIETWNVDMGDFIRWSHMGPGVWERCGSSYPISAKLYDKHPEHMGNNGTIIFL